MRFALLFVLLLPALARAADPPLGAVLVAQNLTHPLYATYAPGDFSRLFIVEQGGKIKILNLATNTVLPVPFLDVTSRVASNWLEYGLLGLAFHPDYAHNGFFYVNYTPPNGTIADTLVARYHVSANPNVADASSAANILRFDFGTRREHRAGWMSFGPDGYLYISTGDGGEGDPDNAAANTTTLRGKILRIDVNGPDGIPGTADDDGFPANANKNYQIPPNNPFAASATNAKEIWAFGLRNPWRCSFDRLTGDLYIGDVGQSAREEVDFQPAASPGGLFYGWRCKEGSLTNTTCGSTAPQVAPIYEYPRDVGICVTGGYVYRGCAMPELRGTYIFADYQTSKLFSFRYSPSTGLTNYTVRTSEISAGGGSVALVSSLGEDAYGELYYCNWSAGQVYKIRPRTLAGPDCNHNNISDLCEIAANPALDYDSNGILDACENICPADFNRDGGVDGADVEEFYAAWSAGQPRADVNHDGGIDGSDVSAFFEAWEAGGC